MELDVTIAGHRAPWRYRGSRALVEWLESQPWLRGGGTTLLHVGTAGDPDLLLRSLRRAVRAADDGGFQPDVLPLTVVNGLLESINTEFFGSPRVDDQRLADECSLRSRLVVVFTPLGGASLVRDATSFSDRARKIAPDFRSAFIIVSTSERGDDGALDFIVGFPDDHVLRLLDETHDRLFRSYLHTRIAWESGGAIVRARELQGLLEPCRVGDDEAVEAGLNEFARRSYGSLAAIVQRSLDDLVGALSRNEPLEARRLASELETKGLLWSPFGIGRFRIVPWAARALLVRREARVAVDFLRSQVMCAPFARELLGRCLELEARERAKLSSGIGASAAPADAIGRLAAFERGDAEGDSGLYPRCSPVRPADAWAFAEFGAFIETAVRVNAPRLPRRDLHALRHLRNALAHGHYASWATLRRLLKVERRLGTTF